MHLLALALVANVARGAFRYYQNFEDLEICSFSVVTAQDKFIFFCFFSAHQFSQPSRGRLDDEVRLLVFMPVSNLISKHTIHLDV